jgi:hypothetical protein
VAAPRRKPKPKAKAAPRRSPLADAVHRSLGSLAAALDLPPLDVAPTAIRVRGSRILLHRTPLTLSAPRTLLVARYRAIIPDIGLRIWRSDPGRWDPVRTALTCDGPVHDDWMALATTLAATTDDAAEAQLVWLQGNSLALVDDDDRPSFFTRLPAAAREQARDRSSVVAAVEAIAGYGFSKHVVDNVIALVDVIDDIGSAVSELLARPVQPTRLARLAGVVDALVEVSLKSASPAVRELGRVLAYRWTYTKDLAL